MRYILEIIDEETKRGYDEKSTIESDSYIPIPEVGETIYGPSGDDLKVVARQYWYTNADRKPVVKVQLVCRVAN